MTQFQQLIESNIVFFTMFCLFLIAIVAGLLYEHFNDNNKFF